MAEWTARIEDGVAATEALPPDPAASSFFLAPWWWRTMAEAGIPPGAQARTLVIRRHGDIAALLPLLRRPDGGHDGLTGPYSCHFLPIAPGLGPADLQAAGRAAAPLLRQGGLSRLDAIPEHDPAVRAFVQGLNAAGLVPLWFAHFGDWTEPLAGRDYAAYVRDRPGALRETIRRRLRRVGDFDWHVATRPDELAEGIAAYEHVYAHSWKEPEPFPHFNATMMREAAGAGALRLGLLSDAGRPVAAQIWILAQGTALVAKLAHDEADKARSPGTILTALMLRRLIDEEGATLLDFGRGDDPYKAHWTTQRRQHVGVMLAWPWHPAGAAAILRHGAGRLRAVLRK